MPEVKLPAFGDVQGWYMDASSIEVHTHSAGIPNAIRLTPRAYLQGVAPLDVISAKLPVDKRVDEPARTVIKELGVYSIANSAERVVLRHVAQGEVRVEGGMSSPFRFMAGFGESRTAIATQDGESLMLRLDEQQAASCFSDLVPLRETVPTADSKVLWVLATAPDAPDVPIRLSLTADGVALGPSTPVPLSESINMTATDAPGGMLCLRVTSPLLDGEPPQRSFMTSESMGYAFWAEFDSRKTAIGISTAGIADLYRQFNDAKKHNLLLVMFGDVLLLNRALDAGVPMSDLVRKLEDVGAVQFAEDGELRDATVKKILTLTATLPDIKQRFELLAAMAPYYWASTETDWLASAFGNSPGVPSAVAERRRIVPRVRRQIRAVQADLLRSLAQIEGGIRPLESILAKDEIRQHWSSRVRLFAPIAVQLTIGAAAVMTGGAGLMAANLIGGAIVTHGLGNILGYFQKDREAAAQVRKVAEQILPWWNVFMRTLVVSIFETAEFVDEENLLAMQRDKKVLADVPEAERKQRLLGVQNQLRKRIVAERRNRFGEVLQGSGVRLTHIIEDMEHAIGPGMRGAVDTFMGSVIVSGRKPVREVSK
jgi:hypothetical protein